MIRLACTLVCLAVICTVPHAHVVEEKYSSKYDDIDVDAVLANPRLRNQYVNCIFGNSPCITGAARFLKEKYTEAYITRCRKCTDKQIIFFDKISEWFTKNEPETWKHAVERAIKESRERQSKHE